ncbi:MAG: TIR domain-containing protein, partial [Zoogloea sp.]|nr:TIR domain-containing protein [Zoogloea sp.]
MPYPAALGQRPLEVHEAYAALEQFATDYGRDPLLLLMHAAVPETLRPDLLNLIRVNFLAAHGPDPSLEADVLFSPLSTALGGGYYRIDPQVRWHCLLMLRSLHRHDPRPRIRRIAELLWRYVEAREHQASRAADPQMAEFLDIQRWVALAFLEPASAAHAFADALRQVGASGSSVALRLGGLASAIEVPLAGQPELLAYARGLDALAGGNDDEASRLLGALGSEELRVGNIVLKAPGAVLAEYRVATTPPAAERDGTSAHADTPPAAMHRIVIQASGQPQDPLTGQTVHPEDAHDAVPGFNRFGAESLAEGIWPARLQSLITAEQVVCDPTGRSPEVLYLIGVAMALRHGRLFYVAAGGFDSESLTYWLGRQLTYPTGLDRVPLQAREAYEDELMARLNDEGRQTFDGPTLENEAQTEYEPPSSPAADTCYVISGSRVTERHFTTSMAGSDGLHDLIQSAVEAAGMSTLIDNTLADAPPSAIARLLSETPFAIVSLSRLDDDALIQLGLRQGLRPGRTLIVAESQVMVPKTGITAPNLIRYTRTGNTLDAKADAELRASITRWLKAARNQPDVDSPVYLALPNLHPPVRRPPAPQAEARDEAPATPRPRVFISYVQRYRQYAQPLARALTAEGIDVAWDMDLKAGDAWHEKLTAMLDAADAIVAVAGAGTATSNFAMAEIDRARQQGKRLLPVLVEPITEPAALLENWVANTGSDGHIRYLGELSEDERPAAIAGIASNIASSLRQSDTRDAGSGQVQVQAPDILWTLTIRQRGQGVLQFILDIEGRRIDAAVHFQPALVDRLLRELLADMRIHRDALLALTQLLIPRELASLPRANRYHLNLGPDTAALPWELLLHDLADPFADLFPPRVIRRLDGLRAAPQRHQPGGLNALLIGNPQTAGTLPEQEAGLPNLPGAEQEVMGVMRLLHAAGFNASA